LPEVISVLRPALLGWFAPLYQSTWAVLVVPLRDTTKRTPKDRHAVDGESEVN